ncbi:MULTISPECIES: DUF2628 domain-containing protein [unclassified Pseudomonas]|uniref:DUF2628 domain-containing protein n=1 Tax=unclassified Pseudomonas TaxID=196821 RepID=UPI0019122AA5|nr:MULTISPECIES: DUF2628 domain-containing protein [unclassified Pseudomonas]MBK5518195.1 DUF2628 domain-containing protein [Pseudomonas sp. TH10]MCA4964304.1 DUF2628 domain-containing protein [Pseudomonas sp. Y24-6]
MNTTDQVQDQSKYSAKWQERFAFFDAHGAPNAPGYKPALKQLPFKRKITVNANIIAFFFGPIYLFFLGLWKKNLTLIALIVALTFVLDLVYELIDFRYANNVNFAVGFAFNLLYALSTNYAYYLKEQKGEQGWNPFKGMRM